MGLVTVPPSPFPPSSGKTGDIAERVTELETNVSTLQSTKAPKTDIAPAFSAETNYNVGDLVYYDGALYECTTEHTAGAWNSEHFTATAIDDELNAINSNVGTLGTTKAPKTDIASAFSAETNYNVGDLVYYDGALYECTTEHTAGAWNSEHFTATAIDEQLSELKSGLIDVNSKLNGLVKYTEITISEAITLQSLKSCDLGNLATILPTGSNFVFAFLDSYNDIGASDAVILSVGMWYNTKFLKATNVSSGSVTISANRIVVIAYI